MGHHDRINNSFAGVINIYCSLANGERFLDNTICKREGKKVLLSAYTNTLLPMKKHSPT